MDACARVASDALELARSVRFAVQQTRSYCGTRDVLPTIQRVTSRLRRVVLVPKGCDLPDAR